MTTITNLDTILGGVTSGGPGSRGAQYKEMCQTPDPKTARTQFDWMKAHEIPDASEAPGVKHRVVQAIGNLCGWSNTK
jgi:hypothetical protein